MTIIEAIMEILNFWLVALPILKNISQWEGLSHIHMKWKIKNVPHHQPVKFDIVG
jgi:hypothetical protein